MTHLERFLAVMEYKSVDRAPNWEAGVWPQTRQRWQEEGAPVDRYHWDWFDGEPKFGMDPREFIRFRGGMIPAFEPKVLEEDERTQIVLDEQGRTRHAAKTHGAVGRGFGDGEGFARRGDSARRQRLGSHLPPLSDLIANTHPTNRRTVYE